MGGGKKGRKASGKGRKASGKGPKTGRKRRGRRGGRRGRKSRYGEEYGEDYGEEYGEDYGEEYGEDYGEEYGEDYGEEYTMVPGTYMTDRYVELKPADVPPTAAGQSASLTKTGKPSKPPTAGKSPFVVPFGGDIYTAVPLSAMVEYEKSTGASMNVAVILLTILFVTFVVMRK
jgi:hypothetical protein